MPQDLLKLPVLKIDTSAADVCVKCTKEDEISEIYQRVKEMHKWMFIGNGKEAWTVRMDRVERVANCVVGLASVLVVSALLSGAGILFWHLFKVAK